MADKDKICNCDDKNCNCGHEGEFNPKEYIQCPHPTLILIEGTDKRFCPHCEGLVTVHIAVVETEDDINSYAVIVSDFIKEYKTVRRSKDVK